MQWKFFSDEMPEHRELIVVTWLDTGAEESLDDPTQFGKGCWFHVDLGHVENEGFGHAFYNQAGKVGQVTHALMFKTGKWMRVREFFDWHNARWPGDEPPAFVLVNDCVGGIIHAPTRD